MIPRQPRLESSSTAQTTESAEVRGTNDHTADFATSAEAWEAPSVPEKRKIISALLGKVVVRPGRRLAVADRIERPDAPDDWPQPRINEERAEQLTRRLAELFREQQAAGEPLA